MGPAGRNGRAVLSLLCSISAEIGYNTPRLNERTIEHGWSSRSKCLESSVFSSLKNSSYICMFSVKT